MYLAALILGVAAVVPFVELDGRLILEPDMPFGDIKLYYDTIVASAWAALPPPFPNVYFEGHSLIYALALRVFGIFAGPPQDFEAASAVTINVVNAVAHMLATMVFFTTVRRLAPRTAIAFALTAMFSIAPQIIDIDLVRIDRFMLLPLAVILHESIKIARGEPGRGAALGAALAVIAATKISGAAFALFPVTAAVIALVNARRDPAQRRWMIRAAVTAFAVGAPLFAVLMIRFVLHAGGFVAGLKAGYGLQMLWTAIFAVTPRFYYNIDLFLGYGALFLVIAAAALIVVAYDALRQRDPVSLWLITNLVIFSAAGVAAFKYSRGGYHLVPLYLYAMAIAVRVIADQLPDRRFAVQWIATAVLLIPTAVAAQGFARASHIAEERPQSIAQTRFAARDWITAWFPLNARICMMGSSQWASPRLVGRGFHVTTQIFDFPFLDRANMAAFIPPRMDQLRAACDGVVFNDLHKGAYVGNFRTFGAAERLKEWQTLFDDLQAQFPPQVFAAMTPAYYVSRVEVYDLRPAPAELDPGTVGAADHIKGSVDAAERYGDRISLKGWAADLAARAPAGEIAVVAGGRVIAADGTGTARRADVAEALKIPALVTAGFSTCVTVPDASALYVLAKGLDGVWGPIGSVPVVVTDTPPGAALPPACLSAE